MAAKNGDNGKTTELKHPGMKNLVSLKDRPLEERKKIASKGGKKSAQKKKDRILISQVYAEFLEKKHKILKTELDKNGNIKGSEKTMSGIELLDQVAKQVLVRGDAASVSMLKEMREATEGSKVNLSGEMNIIYLDKQDENL